MRNGGYKILNFDDVPITIGQAFSIDGMYERIKNTHRKATLLSGLTIADVAYPDVFECFVINGQNYTANIKLGGTVYNMTVTPEDNITVTEA